MSWITPGFTDDYISTSLPWSFSYTLAAALTPRHSSQKGPAELFSLRIPIPSQGCQGVSIFKTSAPLLAVGLARWVLQLWVARGLKLHTQAHTHAHTEKVWLKIPRSWIYSSKGNYYLSGRPQPGYVTSCTWEKSWLFTEKKKLQLDQMPFFCIQSKALLGRPCFFPGSASQSKQRLIPHWKEAGPSWYFILMSKKHKVPLLCRSFSKMFAAWFSQAHRRSQTWS